jgi:hypothetical protein
MNERVCYGYGVETKSSPKVGRIRRGESRASGPNFHCMQIIHHPTVEPGGGGFR